MKAIALKIILVLLFFAGAKNLLSITVPDTAKTIQQDLCNEMMDKIIRKDLKAEKNNSKDN